MPASRVDVRAIQRPIREGFAADPSTAVRRLRVTGGTADLADPLHCEVEPDSVPGWSIRSGAHPSVGGTGDVPCSGDLLLASLAACQETTLRMVAANQGIPIEHLEVIAEADWDPRGTLAMGREYPVGLRTISVRTTVTIAGDEGGERAARLLRSAERYCVILDTLRTGVEVEASFEVRAAGA
ncbi:MAG TPA: OsmC family protein [Actinomycetota bacterium]|nr:OsmC family protein [Actinomycetota bacterium]